MKKLLFMPLLAIIGIVSPTAASTGSVDPTFDAVPSLPLSASFPLVQHVVQPDGKIVVFGPKSVVNGIAKGDVFRLNADGTTDTGFNYCGCALSYLSSLKLAPDGKILIAGSTSGFGKIVRLNADGSVDPSFQVSIAWTPFGGSWFIVDEIQPDGKVLATRRDSYQGWVGYGLYRFNADGTTDSSFTPINIASGSPIGANVRIELLSDGRFYLAVTSGAFGTSAYLRRYNANGSTDPTWTEPSFSTPGFPPMTSISDIAVAADGSILAVGRWDTVNGIGKQNIIRLQPAGNVDLNFTAPPSLGGSGVEALPDGKLFVSMVTSVGGGNTLFRLNPNGGIDNTFAMSASVISVLNNWALDTLERIIFVGQMSTGEIRLVRLLSGGALDATFNPDLARYGRVYALARQTDDRIIVAGDFTHINGVARRSLVRVNADGTLDLSFNAGTGFDVPPRKMVVQPDGRIIAIGSFTTYNGDSVAAGIVRINSDGGRDTTFNVTTGGGGSIYGLNLQADGKILISGSFTTVNGASRTYVARLNTDGGLDTGFNAIIGCCGINDVEPQADGKIMIGGPFSGVNGFNRGGLVRLNSDGSLDESFTATGVIGLMDIVLYPGGKYLLMFSNGLQRRNNDGSLDGSFSAPAFSTNSGDLVLNSVIVQPDGSILVGGRFDKVGTQNRSNLARLAPNGALDILFLPNGTDAVVRSITDYSGARAMIGGDFTRVETTNKDAVARINVPAFVNATPFDFNGDGRADFSVYRPTTGVWYHLYSNGQPYDAPTFGLSGDIPVPADYDGDGITDLAIFRPSNGDWWYKSSINGALITLHWGTTGDLPRPSDFDGDGKADFVVFRPSTSQWFRCGSLSCSGPAIGIAFGQTGDQPLIGDFDGDGKTDLAVFRPSTGDWWYRASASGNAFRSVHWGQNGDIPAPADYDGDGKTDFAVFRPSEGGWYILYSSTGNYFAMAYGLVGDRPVPADYDGDGKADIAVFRPSTGIWYLFQTTSGFGGLQWGLASDVAIPNAYLP